MLFSWPVPDNALQPFLPDGLDIDHWRGQAYLSLVGLWFAGVKIVGIPAPLLRYEEINLRFYVRHRNDGRDDEGCGVVFIRQMLPSRVAAFAARRLYGEPFVATEMCHQFSKPAAGAIAGQRRIAYCWRHGSRWRGFWAETGGAGQYAESGSLEEFLTARYWGYNGKPGARTRAYRLSRPAWTLSRATDWGLDCDFASLCGLPFADAMSGHPESVLVTSDSWAQVHFPRRLVE